MTGNPRNIPFISAVLVVLMTAALSVRIAASSSVDDIVKKMSVEQKVGQMMMFGFVGNSSKNFAPFVKERHIGGLILFKENMTTASQTKKMLSELQSIAKAADFAGLLVSTDQEGGRVERVKHIAGLTSRSNEYWGKLYQSDKRAALAGVQKQGRDTAKVLKSFGINMNLAPVLDVATNPKNTVIKGKERSYGSSPKTVADLGIAYIKALRSGGVLATAKHFPGHGAVTEDSHVDLPTTELTRAELDNVHIAPFADAVKSGIDAVMTAHILYPAYDGEMPATMSKVLLQDVLRSRLGFKGIIITDGMAMGAVGKHFSAGESTIAAVEAGADIILFDHGVGLQREAWDTLVGAVKSGRIPVKRIDESVSRILSAKKRAGLLN